MNQNQNLLEKGSYLKLLIHFSMPAVIIMLVMILYNMADTFFISQTGDPNKIAALSLCTPIFTILSGLGALFGNGGSTAISLALGKGDQDHIKQYASFCGISSLCIGILFAIVVLTLMNPICTLLGTTANTLLYTVSYLRIIALFAPLIIYTSVYTNLIRSVGATKESMIANLLGTVTNILLDALFILVFHLDIMGAAIATVIGNFVSFLYLRWFITQKQPLFKTSFQDFHSSSFTKVVPLGMPIACSTLLNSVSVIIANRMIITFGETALAAQGISSKIGMLITMISMGICMGLQPAISYNYARKDHLRLRTIIQNTAVCTCLIGTLLTIACFLCRNQIIQIFIQSAEIMEYGPVFVLGAILIGPVYGFYQLCQVFLQSTGKASYSTLVSILDKGLIYLPMLFILSRAFGLYGIIFTTSITLLISLLIAVFLSMQWKNSPAYAEI